MHSLLRRQVRQHFGSEDKVPPELSEFLARVDCAYQEFDTDRLMLERSMELSSQELLKASSDMRAILQAFPDIFFRLDNEGRILDCRGGRAEEFWFPPEKLLGKKIYDVPIPEVSALFRDHVAKVLRTGQPKSFEYSLSLRGEANSYEARLIPVLKTQVLAVIRNITERRKAAEELARQRTFLRQVIDMNPSFIFAKDRFGRFTLVNKAVAEAYGTSVEKLLGMTDGDFNPNKEEVEHFRRDDLEVIDTGREKVIPEEMITDSAGNVRWLQTVKQPIPSPDGKDTHVLGVATDITRWRQAERSLRSRTEEAFKQHSGLHDLAIMDTTDLARALHRIVDTASRVLNIRRVGVWLYNDDRSGITCECLCEDSHVSKPSLTLSAGQYPRYFQALEASRTLAASHARTDPRTSEFTENYLVPLGITSMLDVSIRLHGEIVGVLCNEHIGPPREWTPEEQQFCASVADFVSLAIAAAKRRQLQEQLRQSQKMEAVGHLAGGVAHDFNNLLTAIMGSCQIVLRQLGPDHPVRGQAEQILQAGNRAASLTRQLLAFSRKQVLDPKILDLNHVVTNMEPMLRRLIGEDISLSVVLAADLGRVKADPGQIEQVLLNLVLNARDAMPLGGRLCVETRNVVIDPAHVHQAPETTAGEKVMMVVSDSGVGMDPTLLSRIFEPFFTTKEPGKGTGLGLSTVYGIIQQSGGHIEVSSRPGEGTAFKVYLPRVDDAAVTTVPEEVQVAPSSQGKEVVLLVEDEPQVRCIVKEILQLQGYTILEAKDGEEAIEISENYSGSIQLMLTDVIMPRMNGRELFEQLRSLRPEMKVLYMSGYTEGVIARHGTLEEGTTLIQKPFSFEDLTRKVRECLDSSGLKARTAGEGAGDELTQAAR
jgi:PAS domain S-box-containing protein